MKVIGLIGGMSWESSAVYYKIINEKMKENLGGVHSCECLMYSVDFGKIAALQHAGNWTQLGEMMQHAAQNLERGGADFIVLCTNTMHKLAHKIEESVNIPLLHIADVTAEAIKEKRFKTVGLLGTKFTMEQDFLKGRMLEKHGIETIIPTPEQREIVHRVIYEELVKGIISEDSRKEYLAIINDLTKKGAEGIILGCTEIGLLISNKYTKKVLFDTTTIHAEKAVEFAQKTTQSIKIIRTNHTNKDFQDLIYFLDADLRVRDGEDHAFYANFNKIAGLKYVIVAYDEFDAPIACGAIKPYSDDTMEIKRMYVTPSMRGFGIATAVIKSLEKWTKDLGFAKCILETGEKQPEAIGLYKKNGYQVTTNYGQYRDVENSVCFEKYL
jgi:aspartate racemase